MTTVYDARVAAEIDDVVDRVFIYLFIFVIVKWCHPNRRRKWCLN